MIRNKCMEILEHSGAPKKVSSALGVEAMAADHCAQDVLSCCISALELVNMCST